MDLYTRDFPGACTFAMALAPLESRWASISNLDPNAAGVVPRAECVAPVPPSQCGLAHHALARKVDTSNRLSTFDTPVTGGQSKPRMMELGGMQPPVISPSVSMTRKLLFLNRIERPGDEVSLFDFLECINYIEQGVHAHRMGLHAALGCCCFLSHDSLAGESTKGDPLLILGCQAPHLSPKNRYTKT